MRGKNSLNPPKEGPGKNVTHLSIPQIFSWHFMNFLQKPEVKTKQLVKVYLAIYMNKHRVQKNPSS